MALPELADLFLLLAGSFALDQVPNVFDHAPRLQRVAT
jgi:hypothetical protein